MLVCNLQQVLRVYGNLVDQFERYILDTEMR